MATLIAVAAYLFAGLGPTALVATGIVMLLAGMTLVGSVQDALTGYMLTAVARLGDVVFLTMGIVVGILGGLAGRRRSRVSRSSSMSTPPNISCCRPGHGEISWRWSGAALAGACLTVASYAKMRSVLTAGVAAGLAEAHARRARYRRLRAGAWRPATRPWASACWPP